MRSPSREDNPAMTVLTVPIRGMTCRSCEVRLTKRIRRVPGVERVKVSVRTGTAVVHGTADRVLPFEATAARLRDEQLIADLTVVEVTDGPHNIGWTHPDEVNAALLHFLGARDRSVASGAD